MSIEKEKQGLLSVLEHLRENGWTVDAIHDGEEWVPFEADEDEDLERVVEEASATDFCSISLSNEDGDSGTAFLVWGNSPVELISDYTIDSEGFEAAVEAAQLHAFPNYPDDNDDEED